MLGQQSIEVKDKDSDKVKEEVVKILDDTHLN